MDFTLFVIGMMIFFVVYQGTGLWLGQRKAGRRSHSFSQLPPSLARSLVNWLDHAGNLGVNKSLLKITSLKTGLEKHLLYSGNPWGWSTETLLVIKELMAAVVLFLLWYDDVTNIFYWLACAYVGFKFPDFYLNIKATARRLEIQRQLPGFIDLLALTMEGGMDLLAASQKIVEKMKPNALRSELYSLLQENRLGTSRKDSFLHLAHRVNLSDVHSMTSMITQSEEMGTSLAAVLRNYAEDMRSKRILRAEENAGKAPVKLLFPMMVFFFPVVFIIILGPLALNLLSNK